MKQIEKILDKNQDQGLIKEVEVLQAEKKRKKMIKNRKSKKNLDLIQDLIPQVDKKTVKIIIQIKKKICLKIITLKI